MVHAQAMGFYGGCISFLSRHPDCLAQQVFARAPVGSKLEASALQALRAAGVKEAWSHMAKPEGFDPCKLVIDSHGESVNGVQFSPDGSKVLVRHQSAYSACWLVPLMWPIRAQPRRPSNHTTAAM